MVKSPPTLQETQIQFLGWKDPLGKAMATHSSILPGKFHRQRNSLSWQATVHGCEESETTEQVTLSRKFYGNKSHVYFVKIFKQSRHL